MLKSNCVVYIVYYVNEGFKFGKFGRYLRLIRY